MPQVIAADSSLHGHEGGAAMQRKKKCVIVLLVTLNFPGIHISHSPQNTRTRCRLELFFAVWHDVRRVFGFVCTHTCIPMLQFRLLTCVSARSV